jgi:phosphoribosylglycinamide formyltransferase-1
MFRLAVLASGRGSNLRALIEASRSGELVAEVVGVFSDKPGCGAVALARAAGIPTVAISPRDYPSRLAFDEALFSEVAAVQPDLIVCAGYMRILSENVVRRFEDRMINLHPSLLPKYPGLDTHARVLAAGENEHGASVHRVIPALDAGPVLARARVPVLAGDTPETLAKRVQAREHPLLLRCVQALAQGRPFAAPMLLNDDDHLEPAP